MKKGTPGFIGKNLTFARKLRRINMSTLAEELGITRASISAYERDKKTPSPEVMGSICRCLDIPLEFFISTSVNRPVQSEKPVFYRSSAQSLKLARESAEAKKDILALVVAYLEDFINFPSANIPKFDIPYDPIAIESKDIKSLAKKTRTYWGLSLGPISDIICLLENNGIIVAKIPFECEKLEALSHEVEPRQNIIVIGSDKGTSVRHRFDAAHELGHMILHRHVDDKTMAQKGMYSLLEDQAHEFAREFIFPSEAFLNEVKRATLNEFIRLKKRWKLSIASQVQHAEGLGLVSQPQVKNLYRTINRKGWRKFEPFDDEIAYEEPRLVREAFQMILENKVQDPQDIFNRIPINFSDLEAIIGVPRGYFASFLQKTPISFNKATQERVIKQRKSSTNPENFPSESNVVDFMEAFSRRK